MQLPDHPSLELAPQAEQQLRQRGAKDNNHEDISAEAVITDEQSARSHKQIQTVQAAEVFCNTVKNSPLR
jgi:hypothetical protein